MQFLQLLDLLRLFARQVRCLTHIVAMSPGDWLLCGWGAGKLPLKVFSTSAAVSGHLNRPEFVFTDVPEDADILWIMGEVDSDLSSLINGPSPKFLNHFVNEVGCPAVSRLPSVERRFSRVHRAACH
jgi:hypothetical protein